MRSHKIREPPGMEKYFLRKFLWVKLMLRQLRLKLVIVASSIHYQNPFRVH
jgi:hypothetical protein